MKLSDVLATLGLIPKNPEEAKATREAAAATLASVNELFAKAELNLEQMLAAGPDSLKAHLASLDQADGIKALEGKVAAAESALTEATATLGAEAEKAKSAAALAGSYLSCLTATGFTPTAASKPEEVTAAFTAHVEKRAAAILAQAGHPPLAHVSNEAKKPAAEDNLTDEQLLVKWEAMAPGSDERTAFGARHVGALMRADRARSINSIPRM